MRNVAATPANLSPDDAVFDPHSGLVLAVGDLGVELDVLVAFDPSDGAVLWSTPLGEIFDASLAVSADGSSVYVGGESNEIVVVDVATRSIEARHPLGAGLCGRRFVNDLVVLPGDASSIVIAADCLNGKEVLLMTDGAIGAAVVSSSTPVATLAVASDSLVIGADQSARCGCHQRIRVDPDGVRHVRTVGSELELYGGIAAADGVIFGDGVAVDEADGSLIFEVPAFSTMTPAISGDIVYFGNTEAAYPASISIGAFDRRTGEQLGDGIWFQSDFGVTGLLVTPAGLVAWHEGHFLAAGEAPPPELYDFEVTVRVDLRGTDYALVVDPPETCVDVYDASTRELVASSPTVDQRATFAIRNDIDVKLLGWDCNRWGLFPEWEEDVILADWDRAPTIDLGDLPWRSREIYLDPFFLDVPFDTYYFASTVVMKNIGVTTGCSKLFYCPEDEVTRGQMAAFMARFWRALGGSCTSTGSPFADVGTWHFAYQDVACIVELGITTGMSPTRYAPDEPVTREQMAAFLGRLWRTSGNGCAEGPHPFVDVSPTSFAAADIACIFDLGVTTGTSETTYDPTALVTRAQMAAFLDRLLVAMS
ncbi:MAG: S-layer homology domain-containing protein [Actinomycetota bacterium]